jgi:hypothetical protein
MLQSLHFAGEPHAAIRPLAVVEGADAYGVPRRNEGVLLLIVQHARKDAVQALPKFIGVPQLLVEVADDCRIGFAVLDDTYALEGGGLEMVVVVDLGIPANAARLRKELGGAGAARCGIVGSPCPSLFKSSESLPVGCQQGSFKKNGLLALFLLLDGIGSTPQFLQGNRWVH